MAKAEWGIKRICPSCGVRYYDFRKEPPTCPACATVYDPEALLKSRRARPGMVEDLRKSALKSTPLASDFGDIGAVDAEEADLVPDAVVDEDSVEDDALIEDAGELGEDTIEEVEVPVDDDE